MQEQQWQKGTVHNTEHEATNNKQTDMVNIPLVLAANDWVIVAK